MTSSTDRLHAMYSLLQECGEDTSCGCGCDGEEELDEKPKKKSKRKIKEAVADQIISLLDEVRRRRKVGLKKFRNIAKMRSPGSAQAPKLRATPKAISAVRAGAANNRHRR